MPNPDPAIWSVVTSARGEDHALCKICNDGIERRLGSDLRKHESRDVHKLALEYARIQEQEEYEREQQQRALADTAAVQLLHSMAFPANPLAPPPATRDPPTRSAALDFDWSHFLMQEEESQDHLSPEREAAAKIAQDILTFQERLAQRTDDQGSVGDLSDDEEEGRPAEPDLADGDEEDAARRDEPGRKRARTSSVLGEPGSPYYPWPDRITCTLDLLMHLQHSVFSQKQLDLFLWLLRINNMNDVPSADTMDTLTQRLQDLCGIETKAFNGAHGHKFHLNDIGQIISQEFANPKVRPHLHFYPEDSGRHISQAYQADRWLKELPDDMLTPMARIGGKDYYIHEPAMLHDGRLCIPVRWFQVKLPGQLHSSPDKMEMRAKCWSLELMQDVDGAAAWRAVKTPNFVVTEQEFLKAFPELCEDVARGLYDMPSPTCIRDVYDPEERRHHPWTFSNPEKGNTWRERSKGHRVVAFPIWLYCDDTSGNTSKKWNCHNSYLFTPAGLPRSEVHKEYNIHFICTSNTAAPLEMMDAVSGQLEHLQEHGLWAWDCEHREMVMAFPFVLALLGDNPMQSEFACHIGMRGRMFCRACWVEGFKRVRRKKKDEDDGDISGDSGGEDGDDEGDSDNASNASGSESDDSAQPPPTRHAAQVNEAFTRIKNFIKPGTPRNGHDTVTKLNGFFKTACQPMMKTAVKKARTETGLKDTFQLHFIEKLFESVKKKRVAHTQEAALLAARKTLPSWLDGNEDPTKLLSPVWRMKGLDPHTDTPVEILHVLLLGFIKYFWKDVVHNQLNKKDDKKCLLATRICSLNVEGLGLSPLPGVTFVKYAGSLVGRDFRAIAQIAPFVLHGLVTDECYEAWKCLARLVPMIWQPEIADIDLFTTQLEQEIERFLVVTAKWTARWFNKPKFHILVHLPTHIRRFGPAILFATEGFESFNAIIRAKSVHSNRQAPSRDIAKAFAQANHVRHLISGGRFCVLPPSQYDGCATVPRVSLDPDCWLQCGPEALRLVGARSTITSYLGLNDLFEVQPNVKCVLLNSEVHRFHQLQTARHLPQYRPANTSQPYQLCKSFTLPSSDLCRLGSYVIAQPPANPQMLLNEANPATATQRSNPSGTAVAVTSQPASSFVGEVVEIVARPSSMESVPPCAVLVRVADTTRVAAEYGMPYVDPSDRWALIRPKDIACMVNVQHPCAIVGCKDDGTRAVMQERTKTSQTKPDIKHLPWLNNKHNVVLNTAKMRDAAVIQRFLPPLPPLPTEAALHDSARVLAETWTKKTRRAGSNPSRNTAPSTANSITSTLNPTTSARPQARRVDELRRSGWSTGSRG